MRLCNVASCEPVLVSRQLFNLLWMCLWSVEQLLEMDYLAAVWQVNRASVGPWCHGGDRFIPGRGGVHSFAQSY